MRRLFVLVVFVLASVNLMADKASEETVARMRSALVEKGRFAMTFLAGVDGMAAIDGELAVSGEKYRISAGDQVQFSDGRYRYEVNRADRQVIIDNADTESTDILTNPVHAFEFSSAVFDMTYKGTESHNGKRCAVVSLSPKTDDLNGANGIMLYVDSETSLPVGLSYDYNGSQLVFSVKRISFPAVEDSSLFKYVPESYSGYEVIDFR